ncbi:MAG: 50S ribosomal protein L23 [Parcubacteria group bacterium]|nr:50S ribosomal protein L23 [Parcubacteria group bacterium]
MAFNIFKKKEPSSAKATESKEEKKEAAHELQVISDTAGALAYVLRRPHISEKAGILAERNEYVFVVSSEANKRQIKAAVEERYRVKVARVRTSTMPAKKRRVGRRIGEKSGFRKAIVKLAEGHTIEVLPR